MTTHPSRVLGIPPSRLVVILGAAQFCLLLFLGLTRHWSYLTSLFDLGLYDQSLWGILEGAPFLSTLYDFHQPINRLGVHFNPILAAFAPLYAFHPAAEWLILVQALAIAGTAWPLYILGVRILSSERAALLWTLAYLLNPFVLSAGAWDFQSIALAAPLMALAVLAVEERKVKSFLGICFLLLLVREHLGVAVVGFGILWWLRRRTPLPAVIAMGLGATGFVLVLGLIMPALSPTGSVVMMSQDMGWLSRYGWLGTSLAEVVHSLVSQPFESFTHVLFDMKAWLYLLLLMLPLLFTPLLGAEFLLPASADLAANLLSGNPMPRSVFAFHSIAIIPLLIIAGMWGTRRLCRMVPLSPEKLGIAVVGMTLLLTYLVLPFPLPGSANLWEPLERRTWPERSVREIRALLPPNVSVSAQVNVGSHFTHRWNVRAFPAGLGEVDCVVLRLASPTARVEGDSPAVIGSLAHHLQMAPSSYLSAVRGLVASQQYGVTYWHPPWLVVCQDVPMAEDDGARLTSEIDELAGKWSVSIPVPDSGSTEGTSTEAIGH